MTQIEQIRKKKHELEKTISQLLNDFEKETDVKISYVSHEVYIIDCLRTHKIEISIKL